MGYRNGKDDSGLQIMEHVIFILDLLGLITIIVGILFIVLLWIWAILKEPDSSNFYKQGNVK